LPALDAQRRRRQIIDANQLALVIKQRGTVATFGTAVPLSAVQAPSASIC